MALTTKISLYWNMTPYSLAYTCHGLGQTFDCQVWRFRYAGTHCLLGQAWRCRKDIYTIRWIPRYGYGSSVELCAVKVFVLLRCWMEWPGSLLLAVVGQCIDPTFKAQTCRQMVVMNCQTTQRNSPEESRPQLHYGWSLQSLYAIN
jgi:hypothetical protein